jgi:hypothetical protein
LTKEQLNSKTKVSIDELDKRLSEIPVIDYVDLYGGEFATLPKAYVSELKATIRKYYTGEINIVTNFSVMRDELFSDDISLAVSYDFKAREKHEDVFMNMLMSPKEISILILASPEVLEMNVDEMILQLNILGQLKSVEIKPYSQNQSNSLEIDGKKFDRFILDWINSDIVKNFIFTNEDNLNKVLDGTRNAFSDDHVYITPTGKFAVLEFDDNDKEFFMELDSIDQYYEWSKKERDNIYPGCYDCNYLGRCLTEHYRKLSCSGHKELIEAYEGLED